MPQFKTLMDVFKLLEKSNCRKCNEKTCLAFAAAVFGGRRPLADCPQLGQEIASQYESQPQKQANNAQETENQLAELKARLSQVDFSDAAGRIGAVYDGKKLVLKVMGKDFGVDTAGTVYTDIHANPWVTAPVLNYILYCKGVPVMGKWTPLRELPSGGDWYRLFGQRCEKPMKKVADAYPELFSDLVDLFNGQPAENQFQSDVALVLYPLPLIPLLVCYWHAEDGMESNLNLFFDATAEENLGIDGLYALGAGITRMFEKLALRHGIRA
ncbi:DUF3786 domain-containing protein [uncultured Desulfosarcina sp.]|uniref:DUF3786 domain-containing protein n=1 Tax=uncultured Desulfosarcina sp. TaxID=218289 RepID=UPI0029C7A057|nr:DUF3786 domain-containing protein [uncultured Desulfosarcina sp.]